MHPPLGNIWATAAHTVTLITAVTGKFVIPTVSATSAAVVVVVTVNGTPMAVTTGIGVTVIVVVPLGGILLTTGVAGAIQEALREAAALLVPAISMLPRPRLLTRVNSLVGEGCALLNANVVCSSFSQKKKERRMQGSKKNILIGCKVFEKFPYRVGLQTPQVQYFLYLSVTCLKKSQSV
jgi:hypothetical protein